MKKIAKILQNKFKANGCPHILNPGLQSFVYMYYNRTFFMDTSIWYSLLSITNGSITPTGSTSHHSLSFSRAETFFASDWIPKIMVQFCYLRIYLGTVSCRLLQRIYGSRKGTIQKYFAKVKKYFKSKYFFQNHCRKVWQI